MDINIQQDTPPSKVFTDRGGSKYDIAIKTAINSSTVKKLISGSFITTEKNICMLSCMRETFMVL